MPKITICLGPWVTCKTWNDAEYDCRYDSFGHSLGDVWNHGNGWHGAAHRPYQERLLVATEEGLSREAARKAVDEALNASYEIRTIDG